MYGPNIIDLGYGALVAGTPPNTLLSLRIMGQKMKPLWLTDPIMLQNANEFQIQTPTKWEQQITLYPGISSTNLNGAGATVTSWANNATNQPNLIFLNIWFQSQPKFVRLYDPFWISIYGTSWIQVVIPAKSPEMPRKGNIFYPAFPIRNFFPVDMSGTLPALS